MGTRKKIIISVITLFLIALCYVFIKFNNVSNIETNCLVNDFDEVFKKENGLNVGKVYDFSKILNCKSWDEIIIVGGQRANRAAIFLKEGVALPEINYIKRLKGVLLFYLVKDGKLISCPISFYNPDFLYFENFNYFDYVSLKKEDAIFKCVKLETIGSDEEILTFELID
ncbi:MAG: hypothetical protein ABJL44_10035 [Algibacter sp.]